MLVAVHISDGILTAPWWLGGYLVAAALVAVSAWRVGDEEIPRLALLSAAFFVVSLIHVNTGFVAIHLLMNGLVGVILRGRAALAIACGLVLQYLLLGHGGVQTLGINTCVITCPALLAALVFHGSQRLPWLQHPVWCSTLVFLSVLGWILGMVFSVSLLWEHASLDVGSLSVTASWARTVHPTTFASAAVVAAAAVWAERRLETTPEFSLGLLLGAATVMLTIVLNCAVLLLGGEQHWPAPPLALVVAHLPIAMIEGVILGFTLAFLGRVKPELLGAETVRRNVEGRGTPAAGGG